MEQINTVATVLLKAALVYARSKKKKSEEEGFEPPVPCGTSVFKTDAFGHSATLPLFHSSNNKDDYIIKKNR